MYRSISSAMASFCTAMTLEEAMRLVRGAGFDSLDFPISVYAHTPEAPLFREDWRTWCSEARRLSDSLELPVTQAHAPWHQNIPQDFHYEAPWSIYYRAIEACSILGCHHLIFHPVRQLERVAAPEMRERIHAWNVRWFRDLLPAAQAHQVCIDLENTFDSHHVQQPDDPPYPYTTAKDMLALLHDIGGDGVRLCLDTGHANISGQNVPAMLRAFGNKLATVHLNDNYGVIHGIYEDLHLFPGCGRLEWEEIFAALREIGFDGVLNIEPIAELRRMPHAVRAIQLRAAADTLRVLAGLERKP